MDAASGFASGESSDGVQASCAGTPDHNGTVRRVMKALRDDGMFIELRLPLTRARCTGRSVRFLHGRL